MLYAPIDSTYLMLVLPAFLFSLWAQMMVQGNFKKYSKIRTSRSMTGADAAAEVLRMNGVSNVRIERVAGRLTDHFDPRDNVIRLSQDVYDAPTISAVGVAAHEAGHAVQYADDYWPMRLRAAIIPVTQVGSKLAIPLILLGFFIGLTGLVNLGILLFGTVVFFQLVTLPVEFNASRRGIHALDESGILDSDEIPGAKKVLSAAAMTYVAALAVAVAQLLRLLILSQRRGRR